MKTILTNMTVLALLVGLSGCLYPYRDRREGRRYDGDRYEQRGDRDQAGRNCWNRDGQVYCRNGD